MATPTITWAVPAEGESNTINGAITLALSGNDAGWTKFLADVAALDPQDQKLNAAVLLFDGYQMKVSYTASWTGHTAAANDGACIVTEGVGSLCFQSSSATATHIHRVAADYQTALGTGAGTWLGSGKLSIDNSGDAFSGLQIPVESSWTAYTGYVHSFLPIITTGTFVRFEDNLTVKGALFNNAGSDGARWTLGDPVELDGATSLAAAAALAVVSALAF